uniref:PD-(D/E)XK endonuclease-like domain-containing protein n=1 Tax=Palpitomonas bilix TaxID=652834 RepID=A0A7S3LXH5_9EUKA|mmetsp:Transcript_8434/g.22526  ORF Transcript_8434/g.22526 Transcript_8434/m.22526 type:complete len:376 (+) Transcript_8434:45-1172(+)
MRGMYLSAGAVSLRPSVVLAARTYSQLIKNEFSWSFSRHNIFSECQRKYWFHYYGAWNGWPRRRGCPPRVPSMLYAMKHYVSLDQLVGTIVHRSLQQYFDIFLRRGTSQAAWTDVKKEARNMLQRSCENTIAAMQGKRPLPKHSNVVLEAMIPLQGARILEHTEAEDTLRESLGPAIHSASERIQDCLDSFWASELNEVVLKEKNIEVIFNGELQSSTYYVCENDIKIYFAVDLALRHEGVPIFLDWTTNPHENSDLLHAQLTLYDYLTKAKGKVADDEDSVLCSFDLSSGKMKLYEHDRSTDSLEGALSDSVSRMKETLVQGDFYQNSMDLDQAIPTEDHTKCALCPFQHVCSSTRFGKLSLSMLKDVEEKYQL